jgi:hypothetical protein
MILIKAIRENHDNLRHLRSIINLIYQNDISANCLLPPSRIFGAK